MCFWGLVGVVTLAFLVSVLFSLPIFVVGCVEFSFIQIINKGLLFWGLGMTVPLRVKFSFDFETEVSLSLVDKNYRQLQVHGLGQLAHVGNVTGLGNG